MGIVRLIAKIPFDAPTVCRMATVLAISAMLGVHSARWHALLCRMCPASVSSIVQL
jgi:hypothetical protein